MEVTETEFRALRALRPPIGLRPRSIVDQYRKVEILHAMMRYTEGGKLIPAEWILELEDLNE